MMLGRSLLVFLLVKTSRSWSVFDERFINNFGGFGGFGGFGWNGIPVARPRYRGVQRYQAPRKAIQRQHKPEPFKQRVQLISDREEVAGVYFKITNQKTSDADRHLWFQEKALAGENGHYLKYDEDMQEWAFKQTQNGELVASALDTAGHPADIEAEWEGASVMIASVDSPRKRHTAITTLLHRPRAVQVYSFEPELRTLLHHHPEAGRSGRPIFYDESKGLHLFWSNNHENWVLMNQDGTVLMHSVGNGAGSYAAHPIGVTKWSRHVIVASAAVGDEVSTTKSVDVNAVIAQVMPTRKERTCYMVRFDWLPPELAERSRVRVCDDREAIGPDHAVGDQISFKREYELSGSIEEIRDDVYAVTLGPDTLSNGPLAGETVILRKKDTFVTDM